MAICGKKKLKHLVFELSRRSSVLRGFVIFEFFLWIYGKSQEDYDALGSGIF